MPFNPQTGTLADLEDYCSSIQGSFPGEPDDFPPAMLKLFDDMRSAVISRETTGVWVPIPFHADRETGYMVSGKEAGYLESTHLQPPSGSNKTLKKKRQRERSRAAALALASASPSLVVPTAIRTTPPSVPTAALPLGVVQASYHDDIVLLPPS